MIMMMSAGSISRCWAQRNAKESRGMVNPVLWVLGVYWRGGAAARRGVRVTFW